MTPGTVRPADQQAAILRLLDDDDIPTVALVQKKLAESHTLQALRELRAAAQGLAVQHLDELIEELAQEAANQRFTELCGDFDNSGDLEEATWALSAAFYPNEDFTKYRELLDGWGREVAGRCSSALGKSERVQILSDFLGREMRLRGNDGDYYAVENSILPRVLDTRLGIPISLTLIYILVGRRAGVQVDGVGLPGHFLARHEDIFFHPFHGGRRVGLEECAALMEKQNLVLTPQHLIATTARQVLVRMLTNLYFILEQTDPPMAAQVDAWNDLLRRSG